MFVFAAGCSEEKVVAVASQPNPADYPNVVLIVLDTMRQDRMSCFGYDKPTTPNLDALADSARFYDNAYSTTSWTLPAHASIFTGQYPATHGATQENWILSEGAYTLAERYRDAGYATIGIHANPILSAGAGYEQGFEQYHNTWQTDYRASEPNKTLETFRKTLAERDEDKPFFTFVNIIEPHSPYDSAREFRNHFVTDPSQTITRNMWAPYYIGEKEFSPEEVQHLSELYDGETLYADHLVGEIIAALEAEGEWEDTVFVITSDHGENFGERGHYDHVFSLYETTIRVPLIIHYPPEVPAGRDNRLAQVIDIVPTLEELTLIKSGGISQGENLLSLDPDRNRAIVTEYYYPMQTLEVYKDPTKRASPKLDPYRRRLRAIQQESYKYIWASEGPEALYSLSRDPEEKDNLIDKPEFKQTLNRLREALDAWVDEHATAVPASTQTNMRDLSEETVEALQSLGYLE